MGSSNIIIFLSEAIFVFLAIHSNAWLIGVGSFCCYNTLCFDMLMV